MLLEGQWANTWPWIRAQAWRGSPVSWSQERQRLKQKLSARADHGQIVHEDTQVYQKLFGSLGLEQGSSTLGPLKLELECNLWGDGFGDWTFDDDGTRSSVRILDQRFNDSKQLSRIMQ
jgi:hypothetical protein